MGAVRFLKTFLRYLFLTVLALMVTPGTDRYGQPRLLDSFKDSTIRCCIGIGKFETLSKGYLTGFNYELLKDFGASLCDSVSIFIADRESDYADSLLLDSLDILVVPRQEAPSREGLTVLFPVDTSIAWVMKTDAARNQELLRWFNSFKATGDYSDMVQRFFFGYNPRRRLRNQSIISPYDALLKKYSRTIGWDWKLLAALVWSESMFRIDVKSPRGALGLMQMMPRTAHRFGLDDILDPEENIEAGVRYLSMLKRFFSTYTDDPDVLVRLMITSYNCGEGRTLEDMDGREQSEETTAYIKSVLYQYDVFRGVEPSLLSPDGLGGIDPGDEQAGDQEEEHDGDE